MGNHDWPRVTFAVLTYNQAGVVGEAVSAALAQDYPNMQLLLSDDCSTDGTFEALQASVEGYAGPHDIRLNRNGSNLHIGAHVSVVNALAEGELIVGAAGDDISLPHRARRIAETWLQQKRLPGVLHSACYRMHGDNLSLYGSNCLQDLQSLERAAASTAHVIGATEAWDRSMFLAFGDLRPSLVHEDNAIPFRSLLVGRPVAYIDEPLVKYRQGTGISTIYGSTHASPGERKLMLSRYLDATLQRLEDLSKVGAPGIEPILRRTESRYRAALAFEEGWPAFPELLRMSSQAGPRHIVRMVAKRLRNTYRDRTRLTQHLDHAEGSVN